MKPTAQRRRDRRDTLDNLLSRILRGRHLTPDEAALLASTVRDEQRAYDETRQSLGETGTAYGRHRAAADTAVREAEQERDEMRGNYEHACQALAAMHAAATGRTGMAPVRGVVEDVADVRARMLAAEEALTNEQAARTEAVQHLAAYVDIFGPDAVDDFHTMQHRAKTAEERLTRIRDMVDNWESRLPATIRTATAAEAVRNAANGDDRPVMFGVTPAPADDAQAVTAPPVPEPYRTPAGDPVAALARIRDARRWADVQAQLGMYYGWTAEQSGQRARAYRLDAEERADTAEKVAGQWKAIAVRRRHHREEAIRRADRFEAAWQSARHRASVATRRAEYRLDRLRIRGIHARELEQRAERAERLAGRYRLAWHAARRDRKADRAAMAADLPYVQAAHRAYAIAHSWERYGTNALKGYGGILRAEMDQAAPSVPEAITDRATIRNTLDEAEPAECPCPPSCTCCQPTPARP